MADIREVRESAVATLKQLGKSNSEAEAAGRRLERHMTRKEQGLPTDPRPSILHDKRRT